MIKTIIASLIVFWILFRFKKHIDDSRRAMSKRKITKQLHRAQAPGSTKADWVAVLAEVRKSKTQQLQVLNNVYDRIRPDAHQPEIGDWIEPLPEDERMEVEMIYNMVVLEHLDLPYIPVAVGGVGVQPNPLAIVDTQNVHDHTLVNMIDEQYRRLKDETIERRMYVPEIPEIIAQLSPGARQRIGDYLLELHNKPRVPVHKLGGDSTTDLLRIVWAHGPDEITFVENLEDSRGVCTSGMVARTLSSLAFKKDDIGILKTGSVIRHEIMDDFSKLVNLRIDGDPELRAIYLKDDEERSPAETERLERFKIEIQKQLEQKTKEYTAVESGDARKMIEETMIALF